MSRCVQSIDDLSQPTTGEGRCRLAGPVERFPRAARRRRRRFDRGSRSTTVPWSFAKKNRDFAFGEGAHVRGRFPRSRSFARDVRKWMVVAGARTSWTSLANRRHHKRTRSAAGWRTCSCPDGRRAPGDHGSRRTSYLGAWGAIPRTDRRLTSDGHVSRLFYGGWAVNAGKVSGFVRWGHLAPGPPAEIAGVKAHEKIDGHVASGQASSDARCGRMTTLGAAHRAPCAVRRGRFGPARNVRLRTMMPTASEALGAEKPWLARATDGGAAGDVLRIPGRGKGSPRGVAVCGRESDDEKLFSGTLQRKGVIGRTSTETPRGIVSGDASRRCERCSDTCRGPARIESRVKTGRPEGNCKALDTGDACVVARAAASRSRSSAVSSQGTRSCATRGWRQFANSVEARVAPDETDSRGTGCSFDRALPAWVRQRWKSSQSTPDHSEISDGERRKTIPYLSKTALGPADGNVGSRARHGRDSRRAAKGRLQDRP